MSDCNAPKRQSVVARLFMVHLKYAAIILFVLGRMIKSDLIFVRIRFQGPGTAGAEGTAVIPTFAKFKMSTMQREHRIPMLSMPAPTRIPTYVLLCREVDFKSFSMRVK